VPREHLLEPRYVNHFGLNFKASDLTRERQFASSMLNAQYRLSGAIEKRKGYQANAATAGRLGLFRYNRVNPSNDTETPEVLCVDQDLYRRTEATLNVAYIGADSPCLLSVFYDTVTAQYRLQILEGTTLVVDQALGKGFDEASPVTLATVSGVIDALANFTSTVSGTSSTPAAFLKVVRNHDLTSSAYAGKGGYWTRVNSTVDASVHARLGPAQRRGLRERVGREHQQRALPRQRARSGAEVRWADRLQRRAPDARDPNLGRRCRGRGDGQ
jgi:hypothetical protein